MSILLERIKSAFHTRMVSSQKTLSSTKHRKIIINTNASPLLSATQNGQKKERNRNTSLLEEVERWSSEWSTNQSASHQSERNTSYNPYRITSLSRFLSHTWVLSRSKSVTQNLPQTCHLLISTSRWLILDVALYHTERTSTFIGTCVTLSSTLYFGQTLDPIELYLPKAKHLFFQLA